MIASCRQNFIPLREVAVGYTMKMLNNTNTCAACTFSENKLSHRFVANLFFCVNHCNVRNRRTLFYAVQHVCINSYARK